MKPDEYTSDAICQAAGLKCFLDENGFIKSQTVIHILFAPSFHPEVCITLEEMHGSCILSVRTLSELLWHKERPCTIPTSVFEKNVDIEILLELLETYEDAYINFHPDKKTICIDGMRIDSFSFIQGELHRLNPGNVLTDTLLQTFVRTLIEEVWPLICHPIVKNAVSDIGGYVGMDLPKEIAPKATNIAVLGSASDREEFFDKLSKNKTNNRRLS